MTKPTPVVVIPHATVLTVRVFGDTIHVWCPECDAAVMAPLAPGTVRTSDMVHVEGCTVLARIRRAGRAVRRRWAHAVGRR